MFEPAFVRSCKCSFEYTCVGVCVCSRVGALVCVYLRELVRVGETSCVHACVCVCFRVVKCSCELSCLRLFVPASVRV